MSRRYLLYFALLTMLSWLPASAYAQSPPKWGITFQMPVSVGVIWRVNDRIAIRPDIRYSHSSSASTTTVVAGSTSTTSSSQSSSYLLSGAVNGLFYLTRWDSVRTYVSPRFEYAYTHSRYTGTGQTPSVVTNGTKSTSGSFGIQFDPHRHLSAFGEAGMTYSTVGDPSTYPGVEGAGAIVGGAGPSYIFTSSSHSWSMRVALGAIVFF